MNKNKEVPQMKAQVKSSQKKARKKVMSMNREGGVGSQVLAPAAASRYFQTVAPQFRNDGKTCIIKHRELLDTVNGTVAFTNGRIYAMNPGLAASFPWLSSIAAQWEQYRFVNLCYHYIPRCSTTKTGSVMLIPDYDTLDSAPATERQASTYLEAIDDASWKEIRCHLKSSALHPMGPKKFVRTGPVSSDLKTYDGGRFYLSTVGQDNTDAIGKLWVEYEVHFFVPQTQGTGTPIVSKAAIFDIPTSFAITNGSPSTIVFSNVLSNSLGIVDNAGIFTLPAGSYLIIYHVFAANTGGSGDFTGQLRISVNGTLIGGASVSQSGSININPASQWFVSSGTGATVEISFLPAFTSGTGSVQTGTISFTLI